MLATVTQLNGQIGARIDGLNFVQGLTESDYELIAQTLAKHHAVCLAAAEMSPEQHLALARYFGEPEHHDFFNNLGPGLEYVTVLDSLKGDRADMWHTDEQYLSNPPAFTFTHAKVLPDFGGDTAFISLCAAFESLSPRMQAYLNGLTALHDYAKIAEVSRQFGLGDHETVGAAFASGKHASHPLVRLHETSGRQAIFVSPTYTRYIEGVPPAESATILDFLFQHLMRPEFQYRHRWQEGDLMIWDNRCTLHYAVNDYDTPRRMHRISVMV